MADVYRTFIGFVKFEPREADAQGKTVRNIVLREAGVKDQAIDVRATLWPSHEHVDVEEGDLVVVEGKFTVNKVKDKETKEEKTYFNLSVSRILNLGQGDAGVRPDTENTDDDEPADDDDIPY